MSLKRCAVFISGHGSNLSVLLAAKDQIQVALVVSNKKDAYGLERAVAAGVPVKVLEDPTDWTGLHETLGSFSIDGIFLAGFMKILPAGFVEAWEGRLFNIHPSLLPKYKGLHGIRQAMDAGDDVGATVHRVTTEVDSGEILFQQKVMSPKEYEGMTFEEVKQKTHEVEHQLVRKWIEKWPSILTF